MISDTIDLIDPDTARARKRTVAGAAGFLSLAATPTFAVMALLAAVRGGSMPDMLCSTTGVGAPLTGMVVMYSLMSAFHLGSWLKLFTR